MKTLMRKAPLLGAALIFALALSGARALPSGIYTECERNTSWSIWSVQDSRQTSDTTKGKTSETQDTSSRSEQHSSRGEDTTHNDTHHTNADGSGHEHEDFNYSDPTGQGCHNEGIPWKGGFSHDTDWDSKGNRKEHNEELIEKNGKCEKSVRDREWDSRGNLIKDTGWITTEVPCSHLSLQVTFEGTYSIPRTTLVYGPNTVMIPLETKDTRTYTGRYESVFDGTVTGFCTADVTWPVSINVTATEDDARDLEFSVQTTFSKPWTLGSCEGLPGPPHVGALVIPVHNFTLPADDGASTTISGPAVKWTYTVKER
jgi:hypothetical protein